MYFCEKEVWLKMEYISQNENSKWNRELVVKIGFARKWSELDPMWLVYEPCMLLGSHWGCRLICPTIIGSKSNNWTFRKAFGCAPTVTGPWRLSLELWSNLSNNWRPCITLLPSFHKPHKTWKTLWSGNWQTWKNGRSILGTGAEDQQ